MKLNTTLLFFLLIGKIGFGQSEFKRSIPTLDKDVRFIPSPLLQSGDHLKADFNGDGKNDILFIGPINDYGNFVSEIYFYQSIEKQYVPQKIKTTTNLNFNSVEACAQDLNGDGRIDIILSGEYFDGNDQLMILKQEVDGSFNEISQLAIYDIKANSIDCFDFDNDGDKDILVFGEQNGGLKSMLLLNNGSGTFSDANLLLPLMADSKLQVLNFDNDNFLDFVVSGKFGGTSDTLLAYRNIGLNQIVSYPIPFVATTIIDLKTGDFNNDNRQDICFLGDFNSKIIMNSSTGFEFAPISLSTASFGEFAVEDFNNDLKIDILLLGSHNSNSFVNKLYLNNGNDFVSQPLNNFQLSGSLLIEDLNEDGFKDLIMVGDGKFGLDTKTYPQSLPILNDSLNFMVASNCHFEPSSGTFDLGDINGDSKLDIITTGFLNSNSNTTNPSLVYYQDTDENFIRGNDFIDPVGNLATLKLLDLNGDGKSELLFTGCEYPTNTSIAGSYKYNTNSGQLETFQTNIENVGQAGCIAFEDLNNNGLNDILWIGATCGTGINPELRFDNQGNGSFSQAYFNIESTGFSDLEMVDFNGDGFLDLLVSGVEGSGSYRTRLYYYNPDFDVYQEKTDLNLVGYKFAKLEIGDIDDDGDFDFILGGRNEQNKMRLSVFENLGNEIFNLKNLVVLEHVTSNSFSLFDYDEDGKLDLFINGTDTLLNDVFARLYRNTGSWNFVASNVYFPGLLNCQVEVADLEGDGDLDIVYKGQFGYRRNLILTYTNLKDSLVGIQEHNALRKTNQVLAYPNPITSDSKLIVEGLEDYHSIKCYSIEGKEINVPVGELIDDKVLIEMNNFPSGFYLVVVSDLKNGGSQMIKIEKH